MVSRGIATRFLLADDRAATSSLKSVQPYDISDPSSLRSWSFKCRAHLGTIGCGVVLSSRIDLAFPDWVAASGRVLSDDDDTDKAIADFLAYLKERNTKRAQLYDALLQWPGVTSNKIMRFIDEQGLDVSRDGPALFDELMSYGNFTSDEHQNALLGEIAKYQALAYDPSSPPLPFSSTSTIEEIDEFLDAALCVWLRSPLAGPHVWLHKWLALMCGYINPFIP